MWIVVYEEGRVASSLIFGKNTETLNNNVGLNVYGHLGLFCWLFGREFIYHSSILPQSLASSLRHTSY